MSQNIYSNEYYINIDWQLIHVKYQDRDQEAKNKVTAHLATGKDEKAVNYDNFKDGQLPSNNYQFTKYNLMATPSYQKQKMIEAYFDQTKGPDQKITFSWNRDMLGIEYFLPSNAKNSNFDVPKESYNLPMTRSLLSQIGLQLNGTNLSDLLNKKTNLQDSRSAIKANNDNNLKIEEKFVKYCDISSIANVSFFDNTVSKNSIQNDFTTCFINTDSKCKVETKSNINNIGPSKIFSNNAIKFYKQVANYVDTAKIEKEVEEWHLFSQLIEAELYILTAFCAMLFICIVIRWFYYSYHWKWQHHDPNQPQPQVYTINGAKFLAFFILFFFVVIFTVSLWLAWKFSVTIPISNEVDKVKKWNDAITVESKSSESDINVIKKVNGDDKKNFASIDNFMSHYKKQSNTAFGSYFYYFYFVELSQKQTDNDQSTILDKDNNKIVKQDYKQFNDTKNGYGISDRKLGRIIIAIISLVIIVFAIILIYVDIVLTCLLASDWRTYLDVLNNAGAHGVGVLAPAGGGIDPNMIPAGPMNPVGPNMNPIIPQQPGQQNNANDVDAIIVANVIEEFNNASNKHRDWF